MRRFEKIKNKGFTLAEFLAVIAIVLILSAVGIIAVTYYMRLFKHMEYDAMAKEIYIAAQNHISMAYNEGYLDKDYFGTKEGKIDGIDDTADNSSIYFVYVPYTAPSNEGNHVEPLLDIILPFGSIDEKVRSDSSYIIRYDKDSGRILDVFYSEKDGTRYGHTFTGSSEEYTGLLGIRPNDENDHLNDRRYYDTGAGLSKNRRPIVGYYGSESAGTLPYGDLIEAPYVRVVNNEELSVEVKLDPSKFDETVKFRLFIKGEISDAEAYIDLIGEVGGSESKTLILKDKYTSTITFDYSTLLDSITRSNKHFNDVINDKGDTGLLKYKNSKDFVPGENITVWVEAYDNTKLTNIAKSTGIMTNSLYGDLSTVQSSETADKRYAIISNIRHLENLDNEISNLDNSKNQINQAYQNIDLDWIDFKDKTNDNSTIIYGKNGESFATSGHYYPVNNLAFDYNGAYNGKVHSISNINIDYQNIITDKHGPVGLFGIVSGRTIKNLKLNDFIVSGSTNAGALAGTLSNFSTVSNVLAMDKGLYKNGDRYLSSYYVTGGSRVGGLVGSLENSAVINSAAAVIVRNGYDSGGLVGYAGGRAGISGSYAAGHTVDGRYIKAPINVTGSNSAGGLVGRTSFSSSDAINNSYSTCSVSGSTAGGLVGVYSGYPARNSYSTGYVKTTDNGKAGAFIGENGASSAHINCYYLITPNDFSLSSIGSGNKDTINGIDRNTTSYRNFISLSNNAVPYDTKLIEDFNHKYLYKTVEEFSGTVSIADADIVFVKQHYGDWADYQTLVVND